jgi:predicted nucleic acid-binding Zn ribbon protein
MGKQRMRIEEERICSEVYRQIRAKRRRKRIIKRRLRFLFLFFVLVLLMNFGKNYLFERETGQTKSETIISAISAKESQYDLPTDSVTIQRVQGEDLQCPYSVFWMLKKMSLLREEVRIQ